MAPDFIYLGGRDIEFELPGTLGKILDHNAWYAGRKASNAYPLFDLAAFRHLPIPLGSHQLRARRTR